MAASDRMGTPGGMAWILRTPLVFRTGSATGGPSASEYSTELRGVSQRTMRSKPHPRPGKAALDALSTAAKPTRFSVVGSHPSAMGPGGSGFRWSHNRQTRSSNKVPEEPSRSTRTPVSGSTSPPTVTSIFVVVARGQWGSHSHAKTSAFRWSEPVGAVDPVRGREVDVCGVTLNPGHGAGLVKERWRRAADGGFRGGEPG